MTELKLTALASEQSLLGGPTKYFLVFNESLRIEVSEESAENVVKLVWSNGVATPEVNSDEPDRIDYSDSQQDEDGIDQI